MNSPMILKTMPKRGSGVHLKAYTRSAVEIWVRLETDHGTLMKRVTADRLNFHYIGFERFPFGTVVNSIIPFLFKRKGWKAIQVILQSDTVDEGFGVHEVVIRYFVAKYAKRQ